MIDVSVCNKLKVACIFDMDGLLFDTERLSMDVWQKLGDEEGYCIPDELFFACVGHNEHDTKEIVMMALGPKFPYNEFRVKTRDRMYKIIEKNGPPEKPGIRPLFEFLRKNNIPCALATSSSETGARSLVEKAGLTQYFNAFAFGSEVEHGKPEPDIFLKAAERLGIEPINCIVFEDSEAGLQAAQTAGMKSVFIRDIILPSSQVLDKVTYKCSTLEDSITPINTLLTQQSFCWSNSSASTRAS